MARVKMDPESGIASLSGQVGNVVFRTMAGGQTYMQQKPTPSRRVASPAQQQWQCGVFKSGTEYGNKQKRDPEGIAYYERFRQPGSFMSVYNLALTDYSKPPQVLALEAAGYRGQAGALVRVRAHDPYGVTEVQVQVLDAAGQVLEKGTAELIADEWWAYATIQTHSAGTARQLRALAYDRPGNAGEKLIGLE